MSSALNEHLMTYTEWENERQAKYKRNAQKAKEKYIAENCMSLQAFIEKELVLAFREKARSMGVSQRSIIP